MTIRVSNAQQEVRINLSQMKKLARAAARFLKIDGKGAFSIAFIDSRAMHRLNRQFKKHNWPTDVLTFRYDNEPVVGDVLICPKQAHAYAKENGIRFNEELSRYVAHGLLHWLGFKDHTKTEQQVMRAREDRVLRHCKVLAA